MKTTFTKEYLKKAYEDGCDKRTWFKTLLKGTVEEDYTTDPNFDKWFELNFPSTREGMLEKLKGQYNTEFVNNGYKADFTPDASFIECNFGGLLIILSNTGNSVIIWRDWADTTISDNLTECEIEYHDAPEDELELDSKGFPNYIAQFLFEGTWYRLDQFEKLNQQ